jgi:hypothetical protein
MVATMVVLPDTIIAPTVMFPAPIIMTTFNGSITIDSSNYLPLLTLNGLIRSNCFTKVIL